MASGERSGVALPTLGDVPLAHALVTVRTKKLAGVLELRASIESHAWLVFAHGHVASCSTTPTVARFGTVVYELGLLDARGLDAATTESTRSRRPLMDLLVERGTITTAQRDAVLVEQVQRRLDHVFLMPPTTTFTFREGRPSAVEEGVLVDPLGAIWRGINRLPPQARIDDALVRVGPHPLRLIAPASIMRAGLSPNELALCDVLAQTPMTIRQLRSASKLENAHVDRLVYFLVITRCAEVEGVVVAIPSREMWATQAPPGRARPEHGSHASSPRIGAALVVPPRGPSDLGPEEIRRRALGLATETPFETLGLNEGASSEAARAAYFRLAKLWNPSHLPPTMAEVREEVANIFVHMTRAHTLLTDPAARPAVVSRTVR
jgi:hypothetical protein